MSKLLGATLLSLLSFGIYASPTPRAAESKFQWQIWKACPDPSRNAVTKAWEESKKLSDALASWKPKGDYQKAMDMYMGDRNTYKDLRGFDFQKQIQDTTRRHQGLYDGKSEYGNANLWVYCNEDSFWWGHCSTGNNRVIIAYEQEDLFFNNWYITFCPAFYDEHYEVPLDKVFEGIRKQLHDPSVMENYFYPSAQAYVWFHESMHLSQLVTSPQAVDKAYGPEDVYKLARERNTDAAVYNADSWAMTAYAILAQKEFKLDDPPIPSDHKTGNKGGVTTNRDAGPQGTLYLNATDFVPQGAGKREKDQPFKVDTNLWQIYGSPATPSPSPTPSGPAPNCEKRQDFKHDDATKHIDEFCDNPTWKGKRVVPAVSTGYGETGDGHGGTPKALGMNSEYGVSGDQYLWLDVTFAEDNCMGFFQLDPAKCKTNFKKILDKCDQGGNIRDVCAVYKLGTDKSKDTNPFVLKSQKSENRGDWQCEDTNTDAIGGKNSPLYGTCTCWYANFKTVTDVFNKPDGKTCKDVRKGEQPRADLTAKA